MNNKMSAGVTLFAIALLPVGIWYIYLTTALPQGFTWQDSFNHLFSDSNELRPIFYASITSCAASLICSITYFSKASNSKTVLLLLLTICTVQAGFAAYFLGWDLKVIYFFPVIIAFKAYISPNNAFKLDAEKAPRSLT